ncbi:ribonuclease domain-containing protein [Anatilimnocola sp. NA78]|uniref:ribonuclease domain-containing protein n=1 Tax=Anatilimnocola sp. NA78 TaxID=3415683 RepID=UPI003CE4A2E4
MSSPLSRKSSRPAGATPLRLVRLLISLTLVAVLMYTMWQRGQQAQKPAPLPRVQTGEVEVIELPKDESPLPEQATKKPAESVQTPADELAATSPQLDKQLRTKITGAVIRNQDGGVIYRGDIDLTDTLARIAEGERGSHSNDGTVFQNREKRLPRKPSGYYREWVHPTPKQRGPGPQRIVTGKEGEIYYTPDHYETFERLDQPAGEK